MALTETSENDKIEVVNRWNIQVRKATIIKKDGVELTRTFHRHCLVPGMLDASDNTAQNASFGTTTDVAPQPVQTSEPDLPF